MDAETKAKYEARAQIMKAMAHPSRLFIIDELSKGERCVCELTELIGADTSTVSKHLSLLKNAGLVETDKRGDSGVLPDEGPLRFELFRLRRNRAAGQRHHWFADAAVKNFGAILGCLAK